MTRNAARNTSLIDCDGRVAISARLYTLSRLALLRQGRRLVFVVPVGYGFRLEMTRTNWQIHSLTDVHSVPLALADISPVDSDSLHPSATARLAGEPLLAVILLPRLFSSLELLLQARLKQAQSRPETPCPIQFTD